MSTNETTKVGVIGAGAWGTALAQVMAGHGHHVRLWAREAEVIDAINRDRVNQLFLPGVPLDVAIRATGDLADLASCAVILVVTPAQHVRATLNALPASPAMLVLCAKGIEADTGDLVSEIAGAARPGASLAVLSGPTFAHEVAAGLPTAVTLACSSEAQWETLAAIIGGNRFRPYYSDDIVGAEIGGAVKNVLAIACGVVDGAGLGLNARAALISRGFAEMLRFGIARGARAETLSGLSGLGDLVLTCSSQSSRNFSLGRALGEGRQASELMADRKTVAEGAHTAPVLATAAEKLAVDMPICRAVCALLDGSAAVDAVIAALLARPLRAEA